MLIPACTCKSLNADVDRGVKRCSWVGKAGDVSMFMRYFSTQLSSTPCSLKTVHRYFLEVPGSGRVKQEIFLTSVPVRFITNSGRPLPQLKYWFGTVLDKFRCTGSKNKYKFIQSLLNLSLDPRHRPLVILRKCLAAYWWTY